MTRSVNGRRIRLEKGDLTALEVDAFVFYAREDLALGSGFGTAIQSRGGAAIKKALEQAGRLGMGEAIVTPAGGLKARHIVHACGPKFQEPDVEGKLRRCVEAVLQAADGAGMATLAFPPLGDRVLRDFAGTLFHRHAGGHSPFPGRGAVAAGSGPLRGR